MLCHSLFGKFLMSMDANPPNTCISAVWLVGNVEKEQGLGTYIGDEAIQSHRKKHRTCVEVGTPAEIWN